MMILTALFAPVLGRAAVGDVLSSFVPPGPNPQGLTWDGQHLWHADAETRFIYELDAAGSIIRSFPVYDTSIRGIDPVPVGPLFDIAWVEGSNGEPDRLWITDGVLLYEVNPANGSITRKFEAPGLAEYPSAGSVSRARGLESPGPGLLWISEIDANTQNPPGPSIISELDISQLSLVILKSFPARGRKVTGLAWDGESLWASDLTDKVVMRLDTNGNVRERFGSAGDGPTGLAFDGVSLWCSQSGGIDRIDRYDVGNATPPSTVSGRVFGADGHTPLIGASVRLMQNGAIRDATQTDGAGTYQFAGLHALGAKAGSYSIQAFKQGSLGLSQQLTIVQGQNVTSFNLTLANAALGDKVDGFPTLGFTPTGLAWVDQKLWVVDDAADFLLRVDPSSGLIDRALLAQHENLHDLAWNGTSLEIAVHNVDAVTKVITNTLNFFDPDTGQFLGGCTLPDVESPNKKYQARALAFDGENHWVSLIDVSASGRLSRILRLDGCTLVDQFISPGRQTNGLEWSGGTLRLSDNSETQYTLDARGNVLGAFSVPKENTAGTDSLGNAYGDDSLWVAVNGTDQIWRFDTGATSSTGVIQGTVRSASGSVGLNGARARLYQNGRLLSTAITDPSGFYRFEHLPPLGTRAGGYVVRAAQSGFLSATQPVSVQRGLTSVANFQLTTSALGDIVDDFPSPSVAPSGAVRVNGALWVSDDDADFIFKLDPSTGLVSNSYPSPSTSTFDLAWSGSCVLLADGAKVRGIDPATGKASLTCPDVYCLPPGRRTSFRTLTATQSGYLMGEADPVATNTKMSVITRTDPSCNAVDVGSFPAPERGLFGLAWDGTRAWASDDRGNKIYRLDLFGNVVASFTSPGDLTHGLDFSDGDLILADATHREIVFLDAALSGTLGTIFGTVFQSDGQTPIPGALVRVLHNGRIARSTYTLNNGAYSVPELPLLGGRAGSYTLQASAPGYALKEAPAILTAGSQTVEVLINLGPSAKAGVAGRIPAPSFLPSGLAWDGAELWMGDDDAGYLFRIEPSTGLIDRVFPAPSEVVFDLAWDGTRLWVVGSDSISRVNPLDGAVEATLSAPAGGEDHPHGLTWAASNLWVSETDTSFAGNSIVSKLDPSGNILPGTSFPSPGKRTYGLGWDGTRLWASDKGVDRAYRLDIVGNVVDFIATKGGEPEGTTFDGDFLWVADSNLDSLHRMDVNLACVPLNPFAANLFLSSICGPKTLQLAVNAGACTGGSIVLESTNPSVATVSPSGLVTAVASGDTHITATCSTDSTCSTFVAVHVFSGACPTPTPTRTPTQPPATPTRTPGGAPVPTGSGGAGAILITLLFALGTAGIAGRRQSGRDRSFGPR